MVIPPAIRSYFHTLLEQAKLELAWILSDCVEPNWDHSIDSRHAPCSPSAVRLEIASPESPGSFSTVSEVASNGERPEFSGNLLIPAYHAHQQVLSELDLKTNMVQW